MKIINFIKNHGIEEAIKKFGLLYKNYGHKFLLKYNDYDCRFEFQETREARGLVVESSSLNVMSLAFTKFFNYGEKYAADIDWNSAHVLEKLDGSLTVLYYDYIKEKWCVSTTGTAEGESNIGNWDMTFCELFFAILKNNHSFVFNDKGDIILDKKNCYAFELCSPYNVIVTPHRESSLTLLTIRDLNTLKEYSYDYLIDFCNEYQLKLVKRFSYTNLSISDLIKSLHGKEYYDEGYVVVDKDFNRIKVKNPKYVMVHHLKDQTAGSNIMDIIKNNEVDEFVAVIPERKDYIIELRNKYNALMSRLEETLNKLYPLIPTDKNNREQNKIYALKVQELVKQNNLEQFTGFFFYAKEKLMEIPKSGVKSIIIEFLRNYDNKKLYDYLMHR